MGGDPQTPACLGILPIFEVLRLASMAGGLSVTSANHREAKEPRILGWNPGSFEHQRLTSVVQESVMSITHWRYWS